MMEKSCATSSGRGTSMLDIAMVKKAVKGTTTLPDGLEFAAITTDSRQIEPGTLFVALKGEKFDGHDFVASALEKGATAAIVDHNPGVDERKCILARDTLEAYQQIASAYRLSHKNLKVIAITGSNGKTSTKDMTAACLAQRYNVVKTQANFNNEIGLPMTLLRIKDDTEIAVVEMGMRGLGQIRAMKQIAHPDAAIITNVGETHIELLGSIENIARAKSEILEGFTAENLAVLNGDDSRVSAMKTDAAVVTFGIENDCDVRAWNIVPTGLMTCFTYTSRITGCEQQVALPMLGRHNVMNALAAIAMAEKFGVPDTAIAEALQNIKMTEKRQEFRHYGDMTIINDAYNASPVSVKAALETLRDVVKNQGTGRAIAVLADMKELGPVSEESHRKVGAWTGDYGVSELICYGPESRVMAEEAEKHGVSVHYVGSKEEAAALLKKMVQSGDVILLKGSHSMEVDQVAELAFGKEGPRA
jgi:UDP-N-acetylmuramoyl-tripeptide--D-alanyl-D-alanine ligase